MAVIGAFLLAVTTLILVAGSIIVLLLPGQHILELVIFYTSVSLISYIIYRLSRVVVKKLPKLENNLTSVKSKDTTQLTPRLSSPDSHIDTNRVLMSVESHRPFELFEGSRLVIEEDDIIILRKMFLKTSETETILIRDIFSIILNSGPFYASLIVQRKTNIQGSEQRIEISYLKKHEAMEAKFLIDGLTLEFAKAVSVPKNLPSEERRKQLIAIGENKQVEHEIEA